MNKLSASEIQKRASQIKCLFLDIDGVMTDCKLYLTEDGSELKAVNVKDGLGMKLLMNAGVDVAVISGRPSQAMQKRLEWLGLRHIYLDTSDKVPAYLEVCKKLGLSDEQCAMMGDDIPDASLLERVGLAMTVADGHEDILPLVHWQSRFDGGNGAIREAADLILRAKRV